MKNIYKHIALTLKALRHDRGWSLDKTAQETGVSKAMLGQIEREESSPTIATLWKIASGFQTSFSSFIEDMNANFADESVFRQGQPQVLHPSDDKIRVMTLFPFDKQLNFEMFVIELLPGCEHLSPPHKEGVIEHVIVVDGKMEVFVNGVWEALTKDNGLRFNASQSHGYRNISSKIVRFHDIIHYPLND